MACTSDDGNRGQEDSGQEDSGQEDSCQTGSFCELLSAEQFDSLFPQPEAPYSYDGLVAAADTHYEEFTREGDLPTRKREAAIFLANLAHESGNFQFAEEIPCANGKWMAPNTRCNVARYVRDPGDGVERSYHGRGAIQLTGLRNYESATKALGVDLVNQPELVAENSELAMASAVWFWMDVGFIHNALVNDEGGFGVSVQAINGGLECGNQCGARYQERVNQYERITRVMGIELGDMSGCCP